MTRGGAERRALASSQPSNHNTHTGTQTGPTRRSEHTGQRQLGSSVALPRAERELKGTGEGLRRSEREREREREREMERARERWRERERAESRRGGWVKKRHSARETDSRGNRKINRPANGVTRDDGGGYTTVRRTRDPKRRRGSSSTEADSATEYAAVSNEGCGRAPKSVQLAQRVSFSERENCCSV